MKLLIKLLTLLVMLSTGLTSYAYDFKVDGICYNLNMEDKTVEVASNNSSYSGSSRKYGAFVKTERMKC